MTWRRVTILVALFAAFCGCQPRRDWAEVEFRNATKNETIFVTDATGDGVGLGPCGFLGPGASASVAGLVRDVRYPEQVDLRWRLNDRDGEPFAEMIDVEPSPIAPHKAVLVIQFNGGRRWQAFLEDRSARSSFATGAE